MTEATSQDSARHEPEAKSCNGHARELELEEPLEMLILNPEYAHLPLLRMPKGPDAPPVQDFREPYLFPTLAANEKERLAKLWYLTRDLKSDEVLKARLNDITELVQDTFNAEMSMIGLLDNDAYTRVSAVGCPLASVPRRESTCSHTSNLPPGTVLALPNTAEDARFAQSPHVLRGMGAYYGTQLSYDVPDTDQTVVLGALCVAWNSAIQPLDPERERTLVKFAKAAMHVIIDHARLRRQNTQSQIYDTLIELGRCVNDANTIIEKALDAIRGLLPDTRVSCRILPTGVIPLQGGVSAPYSDFQAHLWENTAAIEDVIEKQNHLPSSYRMGKCIRAIAVKLSVAQDHYLIVETDSLKHVFDNIDAMFVRSCGLIICNSLQDQQLQHALDAKASFLRGVQHSLRTSLNGILSASEMLLDETSAGAEIDGRSSLSSSHGRPTLSRNRSHTMSARSDASFSLPGPGSNNSQLLNIIDSSGRELLTIINNLLNLDTIAQELKPKMEICNLYDLEAEVLEGALQSSVRGRLERIVLISDNRIADHMDSIMTDKNLLKQILMALMQNAMENTESGSVIMTFRMDGQAGSDLVIDIQDTGCGISEADRARIFETFTKVNTFTAQAGLGLSFALQYARAIDGKLELVSSTEGQGSLFRLTLKSPAPACSKYVERSIEKRLKETTYWSRDTESCLAAQYFCAGLQFFGSKRVQSTDDADYIVLGTERMCPPAPPPKAHEKQAIIQLLEAADYRNRFFQDNAHKDVVYCGIPLYRHRSLSALEQAEHLRSTVKAKRPNSLIRTRTQNSNSSTASSTSYSHARDSSLNSPSSPSLRSSHSLHFLAVDDNSMNLAILKNYASKRGIPCITAYDGNEAFATFKTAHETGNDVTFIAMDLQMPICDGIESTIKIRDYEQAKGLKPALIYMVTGQSSEDDKRKALAAGCDAYYVKPLRMKTLDDILSSHFEPI